ncbi:MAG: molybdate ABC transporter substrate-binding protein [Acinetobacter sp.]
MNVKTIALATGLGLWMASSLLHADTVKIYAAASLTNAITDAANVYQKQHPETKIVPVFAASSTLAKQITAGAPSDLFFSADTDWMNYLVQQKKVKAQAVVNLLNNDVVVISPKQFNIPFKADPKFAFAQAFQGKLCTGQMESVPVGKYAKQSLTKLNWLPSLQGRIVGTDDVRAALAFVERGECQVGIVYRTDALVSQKVKIIGTLPNNSHDPVIYPLALTEQGEQNSDARNFQKFLQNDARAKSIFKHYGFTVHTGQP